MIQKAQSVRLVVAADKVPFVAEGEVTTVGDRNIRVILKDHRKLPDSLTPGTPGVLEVLENGSVQQGNTTIVQVDPAAPDAVWVRKPTRFEQENRRKLFRLHLTRPVTFDVLSSRAPKTGNTKGVQGITKDISAGGARFESPIALSSSDVIRLRLDVGRIGGKAPQPIDLNARVVRAATASQGGAARWIVAVEFIEVPERHRAILVRLMFDLERSARTEEN